jgi:hypothetical protein
MSGMQTLRRATVVLASAVALMAMSIPGVHAQQGPPHPPGDDEEGANNLSVPAIFVPDTGGSPFAGTCTADDDSQDPTGEMGVIVDGLLEHQDYYVQGVASWQSDCETAADDTLTVAAEWGDNLTNAPLRAGTPIRTEIGFLADPAGYPMPGYIVEKLDPTLLDRVSHYGTLGTEVDPFPEVRVWNSGVTLDIRGVTTTGQAIVVADAIAYTAEVNSTGRVVYGFNWQKPTAGEYTITVHAPTVALGTTDAGTLVDTDGDGAFDSVALDVTVGNKGGGGKGGRPGDRPRGGGGGQGGGGRG